MTKEIVIVGAGVAGLSVAERLVGQPDIHATVIAPDIYTDFGEVSTTSRISTPIITKTTSENLGIETVGTPEITTVQFGLREERGIRRFVKGQVQRFAQKRLT